MPTAAATGDDASNKTPGQKLMSFATGMMHAFEQQGTGYGGGGNAYGGGGMPYSSGGGGNAYGGSGSENPYGGGGHHGGSIMGSMISSMLGSGGGDGGGGGGGMVAVRHPMVLLDMMHKLA
jgi:hypothetical protein